MARHGLAELMYGIATQTTPPSWGYQVRRGATTVWETWEGEPSHSMNMKMLGSSEVFFYRDLAGIAPAAPGFRRIAIRPHGVGDLTWAHIRRSDGTNPILEPVAWFFGNSGISTHRVAQKKANSWGLHDTLGNVAEWCQDFYADDYGAPDAIEDPRGPAEGDERVLRGGSWRASADSCRCSARFSETPGFADVCFGYEAYGFRCVRRIATK